MKVKALPAWLLPIMVLVQLWFGTVLISPLREPGAPWSFSHAVLSAIGGPAGLAIIGLALRNCIRLWRVQPWQATWALVASIVLVVLCSTVVAVGPATSGVWRWWALVPAALGAYLIVILVRVIRGMLARSREPSQLVDS